MVCRVVGVDSPGSGKPQSSLQQQHCFVPPAPGSEDIGARVECHHERVWDIDHLRDLQRAFGGAERLVQVATEVQHRSQLCADQRQLGFTIRIVPIRLLQHRHGLTQFLDADPALSFQVVELEQGGQGNERSRSSDPTSHRARTHSRSAAWRRLGALVAGLPVLRARAGPPVIAHHRQGSARARNMPAPNPPRRVPPHGLRPAPARPGLDPESLPRHRRRVRRHAPRPDARRPPRPPPLLRTTNSPDTSQPPRDAACDRVAPGFRTRHSVRGPGRRRTGRVPATAGPIEWRECPC